MRSGRGRGGSGQRNGDRAGGDYAQWQDGQEIRVTFTVSNVKCGLIIGRGKHFLKLISEKGKYTSVLSVVAVICNYCSFYSML